MDDIYHVSPVGDLREHIQNKEMDCWCNPTIAEEGNSFIVVHNALDGREKYETGELRKH